MLLLWYRVEDCGLVGKLCILFLQKGHHVVTIWQWVRLCNKEDFYILLDLLYFRFDIFLYFVWTLWKTVIIEQSLIGTKLQYRQEIWKHSEVKHGFSLTLNRVIRQKDNFTMLPNSGYTVMIVVVMVASRGFWDSMIIVRSKKWPCLIFSLWNMDIMNVFNSLCFKFFWLYNFYIFTFLVNDALSIDKSEHTDIANLSKEETQMVLISYYLVWVISVHNICKKWTKRKTKMN